MTWASIEHTAITALSYTKIPSRPPENEPACEDTPSVLAIERSSVVVDGRQRAACLEQALPKLRPGGLILFDNSGRRRYRQAIAGCGLEEQHFFGRTSCVPYPDHTSLLSRRG